MPEENTSKTDMIYLVNDSVVRRFLTPLLQFVSMENHATNQPLSRCLDIDEFRGFYTLLPDDMLEIPLTVQQATTLWTALGDLGRQANGQPAFDSYLTGTQYIYQELTTLLGRETTPRPDWLDKRPVETSYTLTVSHSERQALRRHLKRLFRHDEAPIVLNVSWGEYRYLEQFALELTDDAIQDRLVTKRQYTVTHAQLELLERLTHGASRLSRHVAYQSLGADVDLLVAIIEQAKSQVVPPEVSP